MACVLIVEDDRDTLEFMELLLTSSGYDTMRAENGQEALDQMRQRKPCLVLLDMMMPVVDGWEFRRQQQQDDELADVPVVAVTAYDDPQRIERELGIVCIPKRADFRCQY